MHSFCPSVEADLELVVKNAFAEATTTVLEDSHRRMYSTVPYSLQILSRCQPQSDRVVTPREVCQEWKQKRHILLLFYTRDLVL